MMWRLQAVQISSTGAELHALSACAHELTAMRNQLSELGYEVGGASILRGDPTDENPSDLLTKAIASPSKFEKLQSVLLGECEMKKEVVTQEALAVKDKNGVAHCFLIRRRGGD